MNTSLPSISLSLKKRSFDSLDKTAVSHVRKSLASDATCWSQWPQATHGSTEMSQAGPAHMLTSRSLRQCRFFSQMASLVAGKRGRGTLYNPERVQVRIQRLIARPRCRQVDSKMSPKSTCWTLFADPWKSLATCKKRRSTLEFCKRLVISTCRRSSVSADDAREDDNDVSVLTLSTSKN